MKKRKGLDKPVFLVAGILLAIMFVALYFGVVQGWLGETVKVFNEQAVSVGG